MGKNPLANAGDAGLISGSGRSPAGGNGNSLLYSHLENPMDRGTWRTTVHGVTKSRPWLSEEALQITEKRRDQKAKEKKKCIPN